jgi:hypothetical protein
MRKRRIARCPRHILVVAVCLVACRSSSSDGSVAATLSDSAGVQLFEYTRLPVESGSIRLAARPSLVLGGLQDHDSLEFDARSVFRSAAQLADGQLVVGDYQRLRYYDRRGRLLRTVGRGGHGPGEFMSVRDLCAQADSTLLVVDDDSRWTVWDRHGALKDDHPRVGLIPYHACSAKGDLIVRELPTGNEITADGSRALPYALYRRDGTRQQSLGQLAASDYYAGVFFEPSFGMMGTDLMIADPHRWEIRTQSPVTGRVNRAWRVSNAVVPFTEQDWQKVINESHPRNDTPEQRKARTARATARGKPATWPAFLEVRVDPRGWFWITPDTNFDRWYVIDGDGRLSLVKSPFPPEARPRLAGFTDDGAIISHLDEDGAVRFAFYAVVGPAS